MRGRVEWQGALFLLHTLPGKSLRGNAISYTAAISSCEWPLALEIYWQSLREGAADVMSLNAAIMSLKGAWPYALQLLASASEWSLKSSLVSYNAAMSACDAEWQVALALWDSMTERDLTVLEHFAELLGQSG